MQFPIPVPVTFCDTGNILLHKYTTRKNRYSLPASVANSPFFKLDEEVRIDIYRLVLIDQRDDHGSLVLNPIIVHSNHGIVEPALLATNKVVRSEASRVFYYENAFRCYVANYDPGPVALLQIKLDFPIHEHEQEIRIHNVRREIGYDTWDNLVYWLHMCREGKLPSLFHGIGYNHQPDHSARSAESTLLEALFDMAMNCPEMSSRAFDDVIAFMYKPWEHCARLNGG
jgi:hypothetical protein